jgi:hypothetical protein
VCGCRDEPVLGGLKGVLSPSSGGADHLVQLPPVSLRCVQAIDRIRSGMTMKQPAANATSQGPSESGHSPSTTTRVVLVAAAALLGPAVLVAAIIVVPAFSQSTTVDTTNGPVEVRHVCPAAITFDSDEPIAEYDRSLLPLHEIFVPPASQCASEAGSRRRQALAVITLGSALALGTIAVRGTSRRSLPSHSS